MSEKPESLRLADWCDSFNTVHHDKAAAELRRLHQSEREGWRYADELNLERQRLNALNQELTENLEKKSVAIQRIWKERDELRKVNQELLEALKGLMPIAEWDGGRFDANTIGYAAMPEFVAARAVIAQSEGQA